MKAALAISFLRIGATAFGGGMAALPIFEAELSRRRGWLTPAQVAEEYAIAQSVPGVIIVNLAVLTALRLDGKRAAVLAAIVVALPSFLVILALAMLLGNRWDSPLIAGALAGLRPAVIALIAAAAALLLLGRHIHPIPLIFIGLAAGLVTHLLRRPAAPAPGGPP